jgi:hypothetical protein
MVGHDKQMNPIDFEVCGAKVKVSVAFSRNPKGQRDLSVSDQ